MVSRFNHPRWGWECLETPHRGELPRQKLGILQTGFLPLCQVSKDDFIAVPIHFLSTFFPLHFLFRSSRGFMHMRIQRNLLAPAAGASAPPPTSSSSSSASTATNNNNNVSAEQFILGQFSKPFNSVPSMIHHYTVNRLPIRGAEHMCLLRPICEQLL